MTSLIVALYALSAVLPILGFARLLLRSHRQVRRIDRIVSERGHVASTVHDFNDQHADIRKPARSERRDLVWDTALVGLGLVAGAVASIWSLLGG